MRKLPPLSAVRVFEAAARHENFTAAAQELGMTQAAVSYQIRLLEERLGLPLFARAKRRVTLTEAGAKAAPLVSSAFDTLADAFGALTADDAAVLAVSTPTTFASNWIAPRLGGFQFERPQLAVRLHSSDAMVDFAREQIDCAVRVGTGEWPGMVAHHLFRSHFTPMCSPDFLARHPLPAPADLLSVPLLSPNDSWWGDWLAGAGVAAERPLRPAIRLDSQQMEATAAMAGHGVAILNPLYWRREVAAGRLVRPFALDVYEGRSFWLIYPEAKRRRPKIIAFRDWILREIALDAAEGPAEAFAAPPLAA